jgi:predicted nucleic acid-binding protein
VNDSESVVIDSSGWLEFFAEGPKAEEFARHLEGNRPVLVPTIVLYEVYKQLMRRGGKTLADPFISQALRRQVVNLDEDLALAAAEVSLNHNLPMADAIIYATSRLFGAELITSDTHFQGLPGVTVL